MVDPQVPRRAQEIAELIRGILAEGKLATIVVQEQNTFYVSEIPRNLRAGTSNPTTMTYAITETPKSIKVFGPNADYQTAGQLFHALALNVEDNLAVRNINPTLKLPPITIFEQDYALPS